MIIVIDNNDVQIFENLNMMCEDMYNDVKKELYNIEKKVELHRQINKMANQRDEFLRRANAIQKDIDGMLKNE